MKLVIVRKGGSGSGHYGHAGRPGKQGGSLPDKGGAGGYGFHTEEAWYGKRVTVTSNRGKKYEGSLLKRNDEAGKYLLDLGGRLQEVTGKLDESHGKNDSFITSSVTTLVSRVQSGKDPTDVLINYFEEENLYGDKPDVANDRARIISLFGQKLTGTQRLDAKKLEKYIRAQSSDKDED